MKKIYHFPICPFSRKLRIYLAEKGIDFELIKENYWEKNSAFAKINPVAQVPVMVDDTTGITVADSQIICEYFEGEEKKFLGETPSEQLELRRIISLFDGRFFHEVTKPLINEKLIKYYTKAVQTDSQAIRSAKIALNPHLQYMEYILNNNKWVACNDFSLADIAVAAHLSTLDYLNEISWEIYPSLKNWYSIVKSRPSFRAILTDRIVGFSPPAHYANPDF